MSDPVNFGLGFMCGSLDYGHGWGCRIMFLWWEIIYRRYKGERTSWYVGTAR